MKWMKELDKQIMSIVIGDTRCDGLEISSQSSKQCHWKCIRYI